jgi:hypothetical protein
MDEHLLGVLTGDPTDRSYFGWILLDRHERLRFRAIDQLLASPLPMMRSW